MRKTLTAVLLAFSTIAGTAQANITEAKKGSLLWSGLSCAIYAENMKDKIEHERLFSLGLRTANEFYEAVRQNKITEEEADREVPWIVMVSLGGPSDDFRSGVIFSHAAREAVKDAGVGHGD